MLKLFAYLISLCLSSSFSSVDVQSIDTFRVVILAWNRPSSLSRLLCSLEKADYTFKENNFKWKIQVEIRIDGEGGKKGKEVKKVANQWTPSFGNKVRQTLLGKNEKTILFLQSVVKSPYNLGLVGSWRSVWSWRENELFIILEDDSEVSVRA